MAIIKNKSTEVMPYKNKADFLEYNRLRRKRLYDNDVEYRNKILEEGRVFKREHYKKKREKLLKFTIALYAEDYLVGDWNNKSTSKNRGGHWWLERE